MKKKIKLVVGAVLALFIILALAMGIFIGSATFNGLTNLISREDTIKNISLYKDKYDEFAKDKDIEEIKIKSSKDEHDIPAIFVNNPKSKGTCVMVHGLGGSKYSLYRQGQIFYDLGFSLLIYDQRNSGDNEAKYNTFGILESFDTLDVINFAKAKENARKLILYGESYGGSTSLIACGRDDSDIDYLILDCPVADSNEIADENFLKIEKEKKVPVDFMKFCGNIFLKMKLGFTLKDIDATKWAKEVDCPTLIINSKADKITPVHMVEDIYKSIKSDKKEIYTGENLAHTKFSEEDPKGFRKVVGDFLGKY